MDTLETTTVTLTDLEGQLVKADREFSEAAAAVAKLANLVKDYGRAVAGGDLKALRRVLTSLPDQALRLVDCADQVQAAWPFSEQEEERYFASEYRDELIGHARQQGLALTDQDGMLACYPSVVKVQPKERAVSIDRKLVREVRPSKLVARLIANQKRGSKLSREFLPALHKTYEDISGQTQGAIVKLHDIYERWSRRPQSKKDYPILEFTKQIYELDASEPAAEDPPFRLHSGATASKNRSQLLVMITREGLERTYYGIEFT